MDFNIRHAFIITISSSKKCFSVINEIYKENEKKYYELYIKSDMYNDLIKKTLPVEDEGISNKLIGIVENCYKEKSFLKIEKIIRQLNPSILRFFKSSHRVDVTKFQQKYLADRINEMEESEIFTNLVALCYLAIINDRDFIISDVTNHFIISGWREYLATAYAYHNRNLLIENGVNYEHKIKDYYNVFNLEPFEKIDEQTINLFIENLIEKEILKSFPKDCVSNNKLDIQEYNKKRGEVFKEGIYKYIGSFSRYIKTLGLNSNLCFSDIKINNDVINVIFKDFYFSKSYNGFKDSDFELYIVSCLLLYNFVELYKDTKDIYLNISKEEKYKELLEYEKILNEKENKINEIIDKDNKKLKDKEDEIKKLKEEVKFLKEQQKQISNENKELKKENEEINNELNRIKSVKVQKEMDEIEIETKITVEEAVEDLKDKKIAIFGGTNKIKELKNILPNIKFYNELNKDISSIRNSDLIVINSDFFNHAFTKKLNSFINKYNLNYKYICGTNLNKIILSLYKYLS